MDSTSRAHLSRTIFNTKNKSQLQFLYSELLEYFLGWKHYFLFICHWTLEIIQFIRFEMHSSMTSLLRHIVAHSSRHSFRTKTDNHPIKNSINLEFTWAKILQRSYFLFWIWFSLSLQSSQLSVEKCTSPI